jgi:hypothetical protein
MENGKEYSNYIKNKQKIKLYEGERTIVNSLTPEIVIYGCPLGCEKCKTIYTNKSTGIKIVCKCFCHKRIISEDE